jgi:hypothetical protein
MTAAPMHEVKSASAVLADDVICQSFVQSSSTLAYACLLIRRAKYDLAVHVLHSLEAKQASRFKDMVFYLQSQIGIETGEFATVKRRLVPRVHQHPNDMVALSLLESCIYLEFVEWEKRNPRPESGSESGTSEGAGNFPDAEFSALKGGVRPGPSRSNFSGATFGNAEADLAARNAAAYDAPPSDHVSKVDPGPSVFAGVGAASANSGASALGAPVDFRNTIPAADARYVPAPQSDDGAPHPAIQNPALSQNSNPNSSSNPSRVQYAPPTGTPQDLEFGQFQTLANDTNAQALALWNPAKGRFKSSCRNPQLEGLIAMLPHEVPMPIQAACTSLDCGIVNKICFSFQHLTVTSFHAGSENIGLITGNINQSLLTIVRAENSFRKLAAASRPPEYAPHE